MPPIPSPTSEEKSGGKEGKNKFVSRCMSSEVMKREFPEQKQRVAVCLSTYRQAKKKKRAKGSTEEPTWEEEEKSPYLLIL